MSQKKKEAETAQVIPFERKGVKDCPQTAVLELMMLRQLDQSKQGKIEAHLAHCASCRALVVNLYQNQSVRSALLKVG